MITARFRPLNPVRWMDHGFGLVMCAAYVALLMTTSQGVGIPRDESFYLYAGDKIADWVDRIDDENVASFSREEVDRGFKYNHEHPVLMKTLSGVSHRWLHDKWEIIGDNLTAYRLPTMIMAGLALWLTFLLGVMLEGRMAGFVAAAALAFMPRVFFHSHLACFDGPVTFVWLAICYAYLRAARELSWAPIAGVMLGLGFATKLNTFFVPFILLGVAVIDTYAHKRRTGKWRMAKGWSGPLTYHSAIAVSMLVLGLAVFYIHWPWLYHDTFARLKEYYLFHAKHVHYPVEYLGTLYFKPPFPVHFPFVFTLFTVPAAILALGGLGLWTAVKRAWRQLTDKRVPDRHGAELMVLANLAAPILVIALPTTPIFGGTKHWMPAMPFLAVLAGIGAVRLVEGLWPRHRLRPWFGGALVAAMLVPATLATLRTGAHGPAYYNALAGGAPGASALGMPRNFWGYSTVAILPSVNARTEKGARVFWHKATAWSIGRYKQDDLLRRDVRYTGDWTAPYSDWAVYHDQKEKLPEELDVWRAYGTDWPVDGYFIEGQQIMALYHRPEAPKAPPIPPGGR